VTASADRRAFGDYSFDDNRDDSCAPSDAERTSCLLKGLFTIPAWSWQCEVGLTFA
jgi:hypothetical protein